MSFTLKGQKDSLLIIPLDSININKNRVEIFKNGIKIQNISNKSLQDFKHQNLADLLALESSVYIKNYGGGNMSSTALRGGNSNHTSILWNGFRINSNLNGGMNLNLIPILFIDEIKVQYGGTTSMWGSGAIGGSVHLNNNFNAKNNTSYQYTNGSFGYQQHQLQFNYSRGKFKSYVKAFSFNALNNYPYLYENEKIIQNHAQIVNNGFITGKQYTLNSKQTLEVHFWYQNTKNEIPPIINQSYSKAKQQDEFFRVNSKWIYQEKNKQHSIKAAFFKEKNIYTDPIANINALNQSNILIIENENNWFIQKKHQIQLGFQQSFANGYSKNFNGIAQLNKTSAFILYQFKSKNSENIFNTSFRKEYINNQINPFSFSASFEKLILKNLKLYVNINRVNRIPTFNDLYWIPGGKINLLPEKGWTGEIGSKINFKLKKTLNYQLETNFYNKIINDWIIWLPNGNYWSPMNLMRVNSYGIETNQKIIWLVNKLKIQIYCNTSYNIAKNTISKTPNDLSLNKQLIYTPIYNFNGGFWIDYKKISIQYRQNYIGYTYTSSDHSSYLPPYSVGNLNIQYIQDLKNINVNIHLQITNIWNTNYQVIQNRPMPPLQFYLGIQLKINNLNFKQ